MKKLWKLNRFISDLTGDYKSSHVTLLALQLFTLIIVLTQCKF